MRDEKRLRSIHEFRTGSHTVFGQHPDDEGAIDEGEAFAVVTERVGATTPLYRVKHSGGIFYLVSPLPQLRDSELIGYVFVSPSPGLSPLRRICYAEGTDCSLDAHERSGASGKSEIIAYVFSSARPVRIGAYYFGMFSPGAWEKGNGRIAMNIARLYGDREDGKYWWAGVRDLYEGRLTKDMSDAYPSSSEIFEKDWSHLKPEIGWYDQRDPETLERHIRQATRNGISFLNFYWYWDGETGEEAMNDGLDAFLKAKNSSHMDFMLSICEHGWHLSVHKAQYPGIAALLASKYFHRSNYLRDNAGRPIVQVCDANGIGSDDSVGGQETDVPAVAEFVDVLREEARKLLGTRLNVLTRMDSKDADRLRTSGIFDGGTCVAPLLNRRDLTGNYASHPAWFTKVSEGWSFMPCFNERMDERPRLGIMKQPSQIFYFTQAATPSTFSVGLKDMRAWMDQRNADDMSRFLTIYAWNEWHEGGILEPSARDGDALIQVIPRVFHTPTLSPIDEAGMK